MHEREGSASTIIIMEGQNEVCAQLLSPQRSDPIVCSVNRKLLNQRMSEHRKNPEKSSGSGIKPEKPEILENAGIDYRFRGKEIEGKEKRE